MSSAKIDHTPRQKIYFLINSLEWGGAERVILRVAAKLVEYMDVDIITLKSSRFYDIPAGARWIPLSSIRQNMIMFFCIPYYCWKFRTLLQKEQYTNGISLLEIANFVHILSKKKATISLRISLDFFRGWIGSLYLYMIKILYPRSETMIVNSKENGEDIKNFLSLDATKVITIYNPIDPLIEKSEHEDVTLPRYTAWKRVFMTVGRLVWQKHHRDIILTLKRWKEMGHTDFLYYIIGDGPERNSLEQLVQKEKMENEIFLLGSQKNVFSYLKKCHIFLYASESEWFPNVLLEAMSLGVPIVTTDFKTGAREVLYGRYEKDLILPAVWPNGALFRPKKFEEDFIALWEKMYTLEQKKAWIEQYRLDTITNQFIKSLSTKDTK